MAYTNNIFATISFNLNRTSRKLEVGFLTCYRNRFVKKKLERNSIRFRGAKLYNKLKIMQIIPANLEKGSQAEVTSFCHKLKNSYLVSNYELI